MKKQLYILSLVLFFFSCKKETVVSKDLPEAMLKFVKAGSNGGGIVLNENIYNENGSILTRISYKDYDAGLISSKVAYMYEDGRLMQTDIQMDISSSTFAPQYLYSRSVFEYNNNLITQSDNYLKEGGRYELRSFSVFTYNEADFPVKQARYSTDGALLGYAIYKYEGGNVVSAEEYNIDQLNATPVLAFRHGYKYDDKKNPYRNVYHIIENIPFSINRNNITETTSVNYNISPSPSQGVTTTTQTIYEYNNIGYPSSMNENGNKFTLEYK